MAQPAQFLCGWHSTQNNFCAIFGVPLGRKTLKRCLKLCSVRIITKLPHLGTGENRWNISCRGRPQPEPLNFQPETLERQPLTLNPESGTRNPEPFNPRPNLLPCSRPEKSRSQNSPSHWTRLKKPTGPEPPVPSSSQVFHQPCWRKAVWNRKARSGIWTASSSLPGHERGRRWCCTRRLLSFSRVHGVGYGVKGVGCGV